jgi:hypothetical protein
MNDEELEALLESTRPRGPSPELRARILPRPADTTTKRAWPWAAAAAALLIATLLLQSAAAGLRHGVRDANAAAVTDSADIENELTVAWRDSGDLPEADARLLAMAHEAQMRIDRNRPATERPEP